MPNNQIASSQHENIRQQEQQKQMNKLLTENQELLSQIMMESMYRKNKNIMNHKLERNLIRAAKELPPECIGDPHHSQKQKNRFMNFYSRKNGRKQQKQK